MEVGILCETSENETVQRPVEAHHDESHEEISIKVINEIVSNVENQIQQEILNHSFTNDLLSEEIVSNGQALETNHNEPKTLSTFQPDVKCQRFITSQCLESDESNLNVETHSSNNTFMIQEDIVFPNEEIIFQSLPTNSESTENKVVKTEYIHQSNQIMNIPEQMMSFETFQNVPVQNEAVFQHQQHDLVDEMPQEYIIFENAQTEMSFPEQSEAKQENLFLHPSNTDMETTSQDPIAETVDHHIPMETTSPVEQVPQEHLETQNENKFQQMETIPNELTTDSVLASNITSVEVGPAQTQKNDDNNPECPIIPITIQDYCSKLKERNVMFEILGEKCPVQGYVEKDSELFLVLQGQNAQYLVPPDQFDLDLSFQIGNLINDDNPDNRGSVIKLKSFDAEKDAQLNDKQSQSVNNMNKVKQNFVKANTNTKSRPNIVKISDPRTRTEFTIRKVNGTKKPVPKTTIELVESDPKVVYDDDDDFFKVSDDEQPEKDLSNGNKPSPPKTHPRASSRTNANHNRTIAAKTPASNPVPLNSLTSSTRTYARTSNQHNSSSNVRSGTISSVVENPIIPKKSLDVQQDFVHKRRRSSLGKYVDIFFCCHCDESFLYMDAYTIHQSYCSNSSSKPNNNASTKEECFEEELDDTEDFHEDIPEREDEDRDPNENETDEDAQDDDDDDRSSFGEDSKAELNGFHENDLVWVETKNGPWPAFIMKLWVADGLAQIQLIHSMLRKSSRKVSIGALVKYDQGVTKIKRKSLKDNKKLFDAFQASEQFLKKKILDGNVNPYLYFNTSQTNSSPMKIQTKNDLNIDYRKVVSLIKSGKVEMHLIGIYKDIIDCERHRKWKAQEDDGENQTGFGSMSDEELQDELRTYCTDLFVKNFGNDSLQDLMRYMMNVWIPEAIVRSISKCYNVDLNQAETYICVNWPN